MTFKLLRLIARDIADSRTFLASNVLEILLLLKNSQDCCSEVRLVRGFHCFSVSPHNYENQLLRDYFQGKVLCLQVRIFSRAAQLCLSSSKLTPASVTFYERFNETEFSLSMAEVKQHSSS